MSVINLERKNELILERIDKNRLEKLSQDEINYYAEMEAQNLEQQFNDMEAFSKIDERLSKGKQDLVLLEMVKMPISKRLIPFNTEIADLKREVG